MEKAGNVPTIYIAGDSTSTDQPVEPYNSWGQMLHALLHAARSPLPTTANRANRCAVSSASGGSTRCSSVIQPGDYLFIQMGHNDQKEKGDGVGAFTTYKADLKHFVAEAREHGATPVLITSMNRLTFDAAGKITNSLGDYPEAVRQAARKRTWRSST